MINLICSSYDADLLMYLDKYNYEPGKGGNGGYGGHGGTGGPGGRGGMSYSWTTTSRNADGTTHTHYHSNPGGFSGPPGRNGFKGANGMNGFDGTIGGFGI